MFFMWQLMHNTSWEILSSGNLSGKSSHSDLPDTYQFTPLTPTTTQTNPYAPDTGPGISA